MTSVADRLSQRAARARAVAASILDTPIVPRHWEIPGRLRPSPRRRLGGRGQVVPTRQARSWAMPRGSSRRRVLAVVALIVQIAALVLALTLPQFHLHGVDIQGNQLLSHGALVQASGLGEQQSIFTVDGDGVRRRLSALPWVSSVTVETSLPASVRVTVTERVPTLRVKRAGGDLLVSADGATLDVAAANVAAVPAGLPVLQDDRPPPSGQATQALSADLLRVLADTAARFPAAIGCAVSAFHWQPDGLLTIVTAPGWRAVLGSVATPQDVAAIPGQLAALASLKGRVDLLHPTFGYIDLEDAAAPAVGGKPGLPQPVPAAVPQPAGPGHADTPAATPAAGVQPGAPATPRATPAPATPIAVPVAR